MARIKCSTMMRYINRRFT